MSNKSSKMGQSLMELVVVIAVMIIVVGALTFATIASLRNAQFSQNQAQATKLAQEGIEKVRSLRDRNSNIQTLNIPSSSGSSGSMLFSDLFISFISHNFCNTVSGDGPCYFNFVSGSLNQVASQNNNESVGSFMRRIQIFDRQTCDTVSNCYSQQKEITAVVSWTDFSGSHESRLTTILRKI